MRRKLSAILFVLAALSTIASAAPQEVTMKEAAGKIGRGVMFGTGSATAPNFAPLMRDVAMKREGKTDVFYMSTFAAESNFSDEVVKKWHPNLFFASPQTRRVATHAAEGLSTIHRESLFSLGKRIQRDEFPIDTVVVRVSPPDKDGMVSLGTSSDLTMEAILSVKRRGGQIIAEVNPNVPHANGNRIPYNDLTWVTKGNDLLSEANRIEPGPPERAIAKHIADLIPDGVRHTLQVGIGNPLAGIGEALQHKQLDIWSEMGSRAMLDLLKGDHPAARKATFSFVHADNESYRVIHDNPNVHMLPSTVVNDPAVIAKQPHMVAVNTALEVDIFGNVNAERDGEKVISMPGGQPDFMEGAASAPDGKAIMALRSTAKGGISTVVMDLKGPTTTPKNHVDHVVTEFGSTERLRGKSDGFRAYQIISVSNPLTRADLAHAAMHRNLITQAEVDKIVQGIFPALRTSPLEMRLELTNSALEKGLITRQQHDAIIAEAPAAAPIPNDGFADGPPPPPPINFGVPEMPPPPPPINFGFAPLPPF